MNSKIEFANDYVLQDVIICALRYALPRHTYVVDEVCDFIIQHMSKFMNERVQMVMLRDIEDVLTGDYELHACDRHCIMDLRRRLLEWNNKQ